VTGDRRVNPTVHQYTFRVAPEDIDRLGHVNNVTFVRYVQDAATAHWYAVAPADVRDAFVWVCRRHEIDYRKPAFEGEDLTVRTWVGAPSGATWERFTEITRSADGTAIASARTDWVLIDGASGRPRRIDPSWTAWLTPPAGG
jgi:acyl-CoA thioester hydrolase